MRQLLITLLFTACFLHIRANGTIPVDSVHIFRFRQGNDMFYVPYKGNEVDFKKLCDVLKVHSSQLDARQMYISVSSHAASGTEKTSASRMAYLRNSRVKSELITRAGVTERMFVTDRLLPSAYGADSLRDVVVVTFPANAEKVERIAGKEAAEKVRIYIREVERKNAPAPNDSTSVPVSSGLQPDDSEYQDSQSATDSLQITKSDIQDTQIANPRERAVETAFSLRTNLLRWATLTADLGIEYRLARIGILVNGTYADWGWKDKQRRYKLWRLSPEVRYYLGGRRRGFLGAMYHRGGFNYKLGETGKAGDYQGGGITGGYRLPLTRHFAFDFHAALGYTRAEYDEYTRIGGVNVRRNKDGKLVKNYWGVNQLGISLLYDF